MPRKNRGYKRGEPFRDSQLFVIACEGVKREKEYFYEIHRRSRRIRIKVLEPQEHEEWKPAPKWLLDKAMSFVKEFELKDDDFLWFVMDIDRWEQRQITLIESTCSARNNWHLALSNPCFEVWLFMHIKDLKDSKATNCKELKRELHEITKGRGYNPKDFVNQLQHAVTRAKNTDSNKDYYLPGKNQTKVYLLIEQIMEFTGDDILVG